MNTSILLQSLVDAQDRPFLVVDSDYKVVAVNRAYEKAYGTRSDQAVGCHCFRVFHHHSRPCHEYGKDCPNLHIQQKHIEEAYACVHFIEDSQGRIHQTRLTAYPLLGENGERYLGEALEDLSVHDREDTATRMVGRSPAFLDTVERLTLAARSDASVLLMGETGTGKELAAEFIHKNSERRNQPFLTVDCTVLTEGLFESEMFGHERGAFTGSVGERQGLFELANGGTLLLDEVGELPLTMQAKLLRVLESGEFRRIGGRETLSANVRIICATNRHLWEAVQSTQFREDLYYRIACLSIHLPGLRERLEDIPELAGMMIQSLNQSTRNGYHLTAGAMDLLQQYPFPGNVRELRNILHAAAAHSPQGQIDIPQITEVLNQKTAPGIPEGRAAADQSDNDNAVPVFTLRETRTLRDVEARHIAELLHKHQGNRRRVAGALHISERTLYRKLKRYGLN